MGRFERRVGDTRVIVYDDGTIIEERSYPYPRIIRTTVQESLNELWGKLMEEALEQMKRTGKSYAIVTCPCCQRKMRISVEDLEGVDK